MKKYLSIAVSVLIGLAAVSCQQEPVEPEDAITLEGTTLTVGKDASAPEIVFNASKAWTAESDSQWIVPDQTSGEAGKVTLKLSVSENDTWEERSGKVTVTVGSAKTVFTVVQGTESVLETGFTFNINDKAQDLLVPVKTNVEYTVTPDENSSWITVTATKAAPKEGTIKVHVSANTELGPRTGSFTIAAPGYSQTYTVVQSAAWIPTVSAEAVYLSNSQEPYNSETWTMNLHQQFAVILVSEEGDEVTLLLNKNGFTFNEDTYEFEGEYYPTDVIPAGEYEIDAAGKYADNTFSIKSSSGTEKYYTGLVVEGRELVIYDGAITVAQTEEGYEITAILVDAAGVQHNYSYAGAIELTEEFFSTYSQVNWKNNYETFFTTKVNGWEVSVRLPYVGGDAANASFASFTFYSAAGEANLDELPVGTYTFATPENDPDLKYKNGTLLAQAGQLTNVSFNLYGDSRNIEVSTEGTSVTISKNSDGSYNFKYTGKAKPWAWNDEWTEQIYGDEFDLNIDVNVVLGKATDQATKPHIDADTEIVSLDGAAGTVYIGYWYGSHIGADSSNNMLPAIVDGESNPVACNVFSIGSNSYFNDTWSVMLGLIADENYTYEKNFNNRFCSTPVQDGTYTFGTEAKIGALIPLRYGASSRCYAQNTFTGTTYYPVSGSVTLANGKITIDLTCKATEAGLEGRPQSPATVKLTGSTPFTCYYLQDWSTLARVKQLSINSPVSLD